MAKKQKKRAPQSARRANPPKVRALKKSTGWMKAKRVKIVRRGGRDVVYVDRPRTRRRSK